MVVLLVRTGGNWPFLRDLQINCAMPAMEQYVCESNSAPSVG